MRIRILIGTTVVRIDIVHPHSLISAFVVRCLDSITSFLAKSKISRLELVSVVEKAGLSFTWSHTLFLVIRLKYIYIRFFSFDFFKV